MALYTLTPESHVIIHSRSSVHPIEWRAKALAGFLEADITPTGVSSAVRGRLEVTVRDLKSGNKAYDLQLPRTVHTRKFPVVVAELRELRSELGNEYMAHGSVTFHGETVETDSPVTVEFRDDQLRISGTTSLDLRSFGFSPPKVLGLQVYPEVTVDFAVTGVVQD